MPWKRALLLWMPPEIGLREVYRRLGWKYRGRVHDHIKNPDLRLSLAVQMADVIGAPRMEFLKTLVEEMEADQTLPPPPKPTVLERQRTIPLRTRAGPKRDPRR